MSLLNYFTLEPCGRSTMAKVPLPEPRARLIESIDGFEIAFPPKRQIFVMIFLPFWLCGWAAGEASASRQLMNPTHSQPNLFLIVWLSFWTIGGALAFLILLWMLFGKERVILRPAALRTSYRQMHPNVKKCASRKQQEVRGPGCRPRGPLPRFR